MILGLPSAAGVQAQAADNAEMAQMFAADQAVREEYMTTSGDKSEVAKRMIKEDLEHRTRTEQLLADGALSTGNDFYRAAFIFQHGSDANSYLKAHTLAMIAMSKGHEKASWIAAATLDRYLQEIGQPQIYGTQYSRSAGEEPTMEPYDRELISDPLRKELGVPDQAAQAERLKKMKDQ